MLTYLIILVVYLLGVLAAFGVVFFLQCTFFENDKKEIKIEGIKLFVCLFSWVMVILVSLGGILTFIIDRDYKFNNPFYKDE